MLPVHDVSFIARTIDARHTIALKQIAGENE
jgi:hypothetical protein